MAVEIEQDGGGASDLGFPIGPTNWMKDYLVPNAQNIKPTSAPAPSKGLQVIVDRDPPPVGPIKSGFASIPHPPQRLGTPSNTATNVDPLQAQLRDPETRQLMAEAMIGEGNTPQMQQAIMQIILNRARMSGQSIKEVIEAQGQFTSMDYGVRGGHRAALDRQGAEGTPAILEAYRLIDKPNPAWNIASNITHSFAPDVEAKMQSVDPAEYHGRPSWAPEGKAALKIGNTELYAGDYKGGKPQRQPQQAQQQPQQGQTFTDTTFAGVDPDIQAFVKENLALERKILPAELKAVEEKQTFNDQVAQKIMGYMDKNQEYTQRMLDSNQALIDAMPDEQKLRQQELAKVSDQPMDPTRVFGQMLPMLAMLGGAFTKAGVTGSLNAAAAAMTAAKTNDQDAIKRANDEFHDRLTEVMDKWSMVHQAMTEAYTANKDNMSDYMAAMQLVAARFDIPALQQTILSGNIKDAMAMPDLGMKAALQSALLQQRMLGIENAEVKLDNARLSAQAGAELSDGDLAEQAFMMRKDPNYKPNFSFNKETQDRFAHISALVFKHPDAQSWNDVQKAEGIGGTDATAASAAQAVAGRAETEAGKKALNWATETKTQIEQFEGTAQRNSKLVMEQAAKGVAGDYPAINKWIQAGRRATGDPAVYTFDTSIRTFASEFARVMTTGGTGGGGRTTNWAQQEIDHLLNPSMSAKDISDTIHLMQREMDNRMEALDKTIKDAQVRVETGKEPKSEKFAPGSSSASKADNDPLGLR